MESQSRANSEGTLRKLSWRVINFGGKETKFKEKRKKKNEEERKREKFSNDKFSAYGRRREEKRKRQETGERREGRKIEIKMRANNREENRK